MIHLFGNDWFHLIIIDLNLMLFIKYEALCLPFFCLLEKHRILGIMYGFVYSLGIQHILWNYYYFFYISNSLEKNNWFPVHFLGWMKVLGFLDNPIFILYFILKCLSGKVNMFYLVICTEKWPMLQLPMGSL